MFEFNHKKAIQVLNYFALKEGGIINKLKAIKLIWLADRAHLRRYGRPIVMDRYFALPHGPVPSNTKDLAEDTSFLSEEETNYRNKYIKGANRYSYKSIESVDIDVFSDTDIQILDSVYEEFGSYDKFKLRDISHEYPEWKKHELGLKNKISSRFPMSYSDFFENPKDFNNSFFNENEELRQLTKEMYKENSELEYGTC